MSVIFIELIPSPLKESDNVWYYFFMCSVRISIELNAWFAVNKNVQISMPIHTLKLIGVSIHHENTSVPKVNQD